jgi:hypothetical protein
VNVSAWPLIVRVGCDIHETIKQLRKYASWWLEHSPLFDGRREDLDLYLTPYQGLSVSGLKVTEDGTIKNRSAVLIKQAVAGRYKQQLASLRVLDIISDKDFRNKYRQFLTSMIWMRVDPMRRIFEPGFKGIYEESVKGAGAGDETLPKLDELRIAAKSLLQSFISVINGIC